MTKLEHTDNGAGSSRPTLMKRTDFPYVVTLLFACFAWAVTHTVDRLLVLPLVKLTQTVHEQAGSSRLTFEFENITSSVNFKDLTIRILGDTRTNRFSKPTTTVIGGGWDGSASRFPTHDAIQLEIPDFHPGWRLRLETSMTGGGEPRIQLEGASVPAILEPAGWRTTLLEWELLVIALFAASALLFIIVWARQQKT